MSAATIVTLFAATLSMVGFVPQARIIGDGAMQMNGLNEMITISKYWKQWSNPKLIVMVLNNQDLNQATWEERVQMGDGKTESTQSIPDFSHHA